MTWQYDLELANQRIDQLRTDAERSRTARITKRSRSRRARRLGRLLRPAGVAAWANDVIGAIVSPPWPTDDNIGPNRARPSLGR
jgi:hypothetical protein